jgi:hypothetical protein
LTAPDMTGASAAVGERAPLKGSTTGLQASPTGVLGRARRPKGVGRMLVIGAQP